MKKLKGLMVNICTTCHMRCRHCSNADTLCNVNTIDISIVDKCIKVMEIFGVDNITIVGGEPFEEFELLKNVCRIMYNNGKKISVITNGLWAQDINKGEEVLAMLPGVRNFIVSSDLYHLEFISEKTVRNVVELCQKYNIDVSIHAVCANKADAEKVRRVYQNLSNKILINTNMVMPIGAAKMLEIDRFVLREKFDKFSRFCGAGNIYVDINGNIYGCCNACLARGKFFYYGNLMEISPCEVAEMISQDSTFQYIIKYGPRGLKDILIDLGKSDIFLDKKYTCECDACVDILKNILNNEFQ